MTNLLISVCCRTGIHNTHLLQYILDGCYSSSSTSQVQVKFKLDGCYSSSIQVQVKYKFCEEWPVDGLAVQRQLGRRQSTIASTSTSTSTSASTSTSKAGGDPQAHARPGDTWGKTDRRQWDQFHKSYKWMVGRTDGYLTTPICGAPLMVLIMIT